MEAVRILQLKDNNGDLLLNVVNDPMCIKGAAYYLDKKTENMSDEKYLEWLKGRMNNVYLGLEDQFEFENDMHSSEFSFLLKDSEKIYSATSLVIDYAIDANGMGKGAVNYIIPYNDGNVISKKETGTKETHEKWL